MIEVHVWKDGSVSVTRDGNPYNGYELKYWDESTIVEIQEPNGSAEL